MDKDHIPSYQEAVQGAWKVMPSTSMSLQIANVQRERVRAVVDEYIRRLLQSHIRAGLSRMVYALVPSDSDPLGPVEPSHDPGILEKKPSGLQDHLMPAPAVEIVNFEVDEFVQVVWLQGPQNSARFWKQQSVLEMLRGEVCLMMGIDQSILKSSRATQAKAPSTMSRRERREYGSTRAIGTLGRGIGWRSSTASAVLSPGEIVVEAAIEELSIRRATEVGLYETKTGDAVVLRVQAGC